VRPPDSLVTAGFTAAWRLARLAPEGPAYALGDLVADRVTRADGAGVRTLRRNLARAVAADRLEVTVRAGIRSYVRYWLDAFRLPSWSAERVVTPVRTEGMAALRAPLAAGRGVVAALAHLGNWDHAGAWAARDLAPVTTVAERLRPEGVYRRFVAYRARIGIEVLPLTGGSPPIPLLAERLRRGGFVPLLCDRDLAGRGVVVDLLGEPARVAAGPAALAARTGAALHAVTVHHERSAASPSGWGLVIVAHPEIPVRGGDGVRRAVQSYADSWSAAIRAHPEDWHMLQRVFVADLDPPDPGP
jgi:KDO2-lipid IV(A) lauroyltransferase